LSAVTLATNGLQLGEVADLKAQMFQFSTELHLKTELSIYQCPATCGNLLLAGRCSFLHLN